MSAMTVALNPVPPLINGDKPPFEKQKQFRIAMMVIVSMAVILQLVLMLLLIQNTSSLGSEVGTPRAAPPPTPPPPTPTPTPIGILSKKYCIAQLVEKADLITAVNLALDAGCTLVGGIQMTSLIGADYVQAMMCDHDVDCP
eukprot:SAG11_NODE_8379_length_1021_cov_47.353196_1_plen_142_part_00